MKYITNIFISSIAKVINFILNIVIIRFWGGEVFGGYITIQNIVLSAYTLVNVGQSYNLLYFRQDKIRRIVVLLNFFLPLLLTPIVFLVLSVKYSLSNMDILAVIVAVFLNSISGVYIANMYYEQMSKRAVLISSMSPIALLPLMFLAGNVGLNLSHREIILIFYLIPVLICILVYRNIGVLSLFDLNKVKALLLINLLKRGGGLVLGIFSLGMINTLFLLETYSSQPEVNEVIAVIFPVLGLILLIPTSLNNLILSDKDNLNNIFLLKLIGLLFLAGAFIYFVGWKLYLLAVGHVVSLSDLELIVFILGSVFLSVAKLLLSMLLKMKLLKVVNKIMFFVVVFLVLLLSYIKASEILQWASIYLIVNFIVMFILYGLYYMKSVKVHE